MSETFSEDDYSNATEQEALALCNKFNICCQEREDCQVHVRCVSLLRTRVEEQICNQNEIGEYEDIGKLSGFCTNGGRIKEMQTSIGKLRRVCMLGDAKWSEKGTKAKACNYVHAIHKNSNNVSDRSMYTLPEASERVEPKGLGGSFSIVVDTFDESVHRNLASSMGYDLLTNGRDLEKLDYYYECVAEFGINHIIVIGEMLYGLLFIDCYGRVFQWEEMEQVLWKVGNSLEDTKSHEDYIVWTVEDGVVYEESRDPLRQRKPSSVEVTKPNSVKSTKNNRSKKKKKTKSK